MGAPENPPACVTCRFAQAFPDPGTAPEIPPEPKRSWLWGGEDIFSASLRAGPLTAWWSHKNMHDNFVRCRRYPGKPPAMGKTDYCGEYARSQGGER